MNRRTLSMRLALSALALVGLTHPCPAQAQEIPKDRVPFKAAFKGDFHTLLVPGNPAIISIRETGAGEATPLGQFTWAAHLIDHFDLELGQDLFAEGIGAFTAANGDAINVKYAAIRRPSSNPNLLLLEGAFAVTGGKGRFSGATGSGTIRFEVVPSTDTNPMGKVTTSWEGTVSAPKQ